MKVTYGDREHDGGHPYIPIYADDKVVALGIGGMSIDQEAAEAIAAEAVRRGKTMTPADVECFLNALDSKAGIRP